MKTSLATTAAVLTLAWATLVAAGEAEDQYAVAAAHYARQRWSLAAEEFGAFLERHGDHASANDARFFCAESLVKLRRLEVARQQHQRYLEAAPAGKHAPRALFRVGELSRLLGEHELAQARLAEYCQRHSQHELAAIALGYLGEYDLAASRWQDAKARFQAALDAAPNAPRSDDCRLGLARAMEETGDVERAVILYQALADKPGCPIADQAAFHLGRRHFLNEDFAAARAVFGEFSQKFAASPWRDAALLAAARSALKLGDESAAEQDLARLLASEAAGAEATLRLGLLHKERARWQTAADVLTEGAQRHAANVLSPVLHFHAGDAWLMIDEFARATAEFQSVNAMRPEHELADDAALGLTKAALLAGRHEEAQRYAADFARLFAASPLRREANRLHAQSLLEQCQFASAAGLLRTCLDPKARDQETLQERHLLALAEIGLKQHDRALATLQGIIDHGQGDLAHEAQLTQAIALVGQGKHVEAIAPLESYLQARPQGERIDRCRAELALCYARGGDFNQARRLHTDLLARGANASVIGQATLALAELCYASDRFAEAEELFELELNAKTSAAEHAAALAGAAWSQWKQAQLAQAAETFARLLAEHPGDALAGPAAVARAQVLEQAQQWEAALAAWNVVASEFPDAVRTPQALVAAALLHVRLGRPDAAGELLARLEREFPQDQGGQAILYHAAWALLAEGRVGDAESHFQRIHDEFPVGPYWDDATYRLADAALQDGQLDQASDLAGQVIAVRPDEELLANAHYVLGAAAIRREDWSIARASLAIAALRAPDASLRRLAFRWQVEAQFELGEHVELCAALMPRLDEYRQDAEAWSQLALRLGQSQLHVGQRSAAERMARRILDEQPGFARRYEADYLLGRCLAEQGLLDDARDAFRRVVRSAAAGKTETAAMAQWMIGETYFHQRNHAAALREYLRVEILYAYPAWQAAALLQAGKCCEHLSERDQAAEMYSRVVNEFTQTEVHAEAERRLRAVRVQ